MFNFLRTLRCYAERELTLRARSNPQVLDKCTRSTASRWAGSFCMPVCVESSDRKLLENWFFDLPAFSTLDYFVVTAQLNGQRIPLLLRSVSCIAGPKRRHPCFCSIVGHASLSRYANNERTGAPIALPSSFYGSRSVISVVVRRSRTVIDRHRASQASTLPSFYRKASHKVVFSHWWPTLEGRGL